MHFFQFDERSAQAQSAVSLKILAIAKMTAILMLSLLSIACKSHERYEGKVSAWPTGWRLIGNVRILGFISEYLRKRWKVGRKSPRAICYAFQLPIRGIQGKQQFCLKPFPMISNDFKEIEVIQPIGVKPNAKGANPHLAEQEILLRQNRASREFESCSLFLKQYSLPQRAFMVYYVRSYASRSRFQGESWVYKILRNFCHYQTFKSQLVKGFNRMSSTANFN